MLAKCTNQPNAPDWTGWTPLRIATAKGLQDIMKFLASCSDNQCWGCSQYGSKERFKTCTKCKLAKYHDFQCQQDDWTIKFSNLEDNIFFHQYVSILDY